MTLLETAQALKGEALDTWLDTLSPEETKELWIETLTAALEVLDKIVEAFSPYREV